MPDAADLKARAQVAIDGRRKWLIDAATSISRQPETGFREAKTAGFVSELMVQLGVEHRTEIALTGIKGYLNGARSGPTVALLGELDALKVPGHPDADPTTGAAHACGHHCQIGSLLGAAVGLNVPEVLDGLAGRVAIMAVPAEEFTEIEYRWDLHRRGKIGLMSGKQEFIRLGAFDDVDMAMMVHASASPDDSRFAIGGTSNGHLVKYVRFLGRGAHAGSAPHQGVNALQAAMLALSALNTQRETLKNEDTVRLHGILTSGGDSANAVPAEAKYEGRVRAGTLEAIDDANTKMDRCLRAGALAMGGAVHIVTVPGYLPIINDGGLMEVFGRNAASLVGAENVVRHPDGRNRGGSTDMGDLSQIMPVIHPYAGGASGTGHGSDFMITDYDQAVVKPAKALAMAVIDLLSDGAAPAKEILATGRPAMTKARYLELQEKRLTQEMYEGV